MNPILVFKYPERRTRAPFPVQGIGRTYTHANYSEEHGAHVFEMPLAEYLTCAEDMLRATDRPLCKFHLVAVKLPEVEELREELATAQAEKHRAVLEVGAKVAEIFEKGQREEGVEIIEDGKSRRYRVQRLKDRADWNFQDWYAHAKKIGVKSYSVIAKPGRLEPLKKAVEAHENASKTHPGEAAPPAPSDESAPEEPGLSAHCETAAA